MGQLPPTHRFWAPNTQAQRLPLSSTITLGAQCSLSTGEDAGLPRRENSPESYSLVRTHRSRGRGARGATRAGSGLRTGPTRRPRSEAGGCGERAGEPGCPGRRREVGAAGRPRQDPLTPCRQPRQASAAFGDACGRSRSRRGRRHLPQTSSASGTRPWRAAELPPWQRGDGSALGTKF